MGADSASRSELGGVLNFGYFDTDSQNCIDVYAVDALEEVNYFSTHNSDVLRLYQQESPPEGPIVRSLRGISKLMGTDTCAFTSTSVSTSTSVGAKENKKWKKFLRHSRSSYFVSLIGERCCSEGVLPGGSSAY